MQFKQLNVFFIGAIIALQSANESFSMEKEVDRKKDLSSTVDKNKQLKLDQELAEAVSFGEVNNVRALLSQGANPNYVHEGHSVLRRALEASNFCDANKHLLNDYMEIVKELQKHGISLNVLDHSSLPLDLALRGQCPIRMIQFLLDLQVNPNLRDSFGETILHHAALQDNPTIIISLLVANADRELKNKYGQTALAVLRERSDERSSVSEVLQHAQGQLLNDAIHYGVEWAVRRLLDTRMASNQNINHVDERGMTLLGQAVDSDQPLMVTLLIDTYGANANQPYGVPATSPLQAAINLGHHNVARALRARGAQLATDAQTSLSVTRQSAERHMAQQNQGWRSWFSWGGGKDSGVGS